MTTTAPLCVRHFRAAKKQFDPALLRSFNYCAEKAVSVFVGRLDYLAYI
jgi:hypothetical protein